MFANEPHAFGSLRQVIMGLILPQVLSSILRLAVPVQFQQTYVEEQNGQRLPNKGW